MHRFARFAASSAAVLLVMLAQSNAQASFCSSVQQVSRIAADDNLASIGLGNFHTGPDSAGHDGEYPSDDTQRTSLSLDGATLCGLHALPNLGTHSYDCDFNATERSLRARVQSCYPGVRPDRSKPGDETVWALKFGTKRAGITVWPIGSYQTRITIHYAGKAGDDDDAFPLM